MRPREDSRLAPVVTASAADLASWIVARGEGWVVVDKPAGVLSQPDGTSAPDLVGLGREALHQPSLGALHRVDRNVSGLVLLAWAAAATRLSAALRAGGVRRRYRALALGHAAERFVIDADLRKDERRNLVESRPRAERRVDAGELVAAGSAARSGELVAADPKDSAVRSGELHGWERAETRVRRLVETRAPLGVVSELEIELVTGRSHQIRAHLAFSGLPLIGDPKYGVEASVLPPRTSSPGVRAAPLRRPLLHAETLGFEARRGEPVELTSAPPWSPDLAGRLAKPRRRGT